MGDFRPTSPAVVGGYIKALKKNKAPGSDAITNAVLKTLPRKQIVTVCNIINAMMRLQYFPNIWKEATVVCLPKPGKPLSAPSSFRPVSLLSSLSKVAETVILARLNIHVKEKKILPDFQHGFLAEHGSVHQLLRVGEHVADKFNKKWFTSMLLLDAKQAFDRVWHDGLLYKMVELKFPDYLVGLTKSFLTGRSLRVRVGKTKSEPHNIGSGVPQGSKLSPTLFNIFCHDIPSDKRIMTAQFADDVALIYSSKNYTRATSTLNNFIPKLLDWYSMWRLELNETKSEAIFFVYSKKKYDYPDKLVVNGHKVPWKPSAKYLGAIFDQGLTWSKHIQATRNKMLGAFQGLRPFFQNETVSPATKARAFNAIIRSISTYAIPIWGCAAPSEMQKLQSTYMRLMRSALGYPWYVRNDQILAETKIPSITGAAKTYAANLRSSVVGHTNPSIRVLADYSRKWYDKAGRPCHLIPQQ